MFRLEPTRSWLFKDPLAIRSRLASLWHYNMSQLSYSLPSARIVEVAPDCLGSVHSALRLAQGETIQTLLTDFHSKLYEAAQEHAYIVTCLHINERCVTIELLATSTLKRMSLVVIHVAACGCRNLLLAS